ncbi:MAG: PQQ-dependent sugar dehydrogenase [Ferruginibacter sp.]|nr:PQQ-dependent sugar dehydrogenase [Ferruginibacter sp.]
MKKLLLCFLIAGAIFECTNAQIVLVNLGVTTVETSPLYTTSEPPWELKYGPGDSLWMTTKNGKVYRIHPSTGVATLLLDYSGTVYQGGEAGMLGMTFHPDFANNPYVYISYNYTNAGNKERLSRFTYNGTALTSELTLIDNIAANTTHNGSRLLILPDNTILMTTGDAANTANSQNTASLNGKILRVNLDGSIPADNPIAGNRIYSFGHRNPQGLMLHTNGKIYSTEHGPGNNDEFQVIEPGRNYGWPNVEGFCDNDVAGEAAFCSANNVKEPLASWNPVPGGTWAPSDLIWYTHPSIPEFQNSFLVAFLKTEKVRSIRINAAGDAIATQTDYFAGRWGRLRDITAGPEGSIYIATNVSPYRIIKVRATLVTPVVVTDYKATCDREKFTIAWTTKTEINNKHFLIYKSSDGLKFDLAATVTSIAPEGNSGVSLPYSYTDNGIPGSSVLYKLVSEDKDGRKKDWGIVTPACGRMGIKFALLPNPATSQSILTINGITELLNINVYNTLGQSVYQNRANGSVNLPVAKWAPGIYHVTVTSTRKEILFKNTLVVQ